MYIAELSVNHSKVQSTTATEAFIASSTLIGYLMFVCAHYKVIKGADKSAGPVQSKIPLVATLATILHIGAFTALIMIYCFSVGFNGFHQPDWMEIYRLPDQWGAKLGLGRCLVVRSLAALVAAIWLPTTNAVIMNELGSQFSLIGVREKPTIISTGPYSWIRHPMYTSVLFVQPLLAVAFWSWMPLYALGIMALAFLVKIPYEENLILERAEVRDAYTEYKKKSPCRLIPCVW